jgi:hypothetical protein
MLLRRLARALGVPDLLCECLNHLGGQLASSSESFTYARCTVVEIVKE